MFKILLLWAYKKHWAQSSPRQKNLQLLISKSTYFIKVTWLYRTIGWNHSHICLVLIRRIDSDDGLIEIWYNFPNMAKYWEKYNTHLKRYVKDSEMNWENGWMRKTMHNSTFQYDCTFFWTMKNEHISFSLKWHNSQQCYQISNSWNWEMSKKQIDRGAHFSNNCSVSWPIHIWGFRRCRFVCSW